MSWRDLARRLLVPPGEDVVVERRLPDGAELTTWAALLGDGVVLVVGDGVEGALAVAGRRLRAATATTAQGRLLAGETAAERLAAASALTASVRSVDASLLAALPAAWGALVPATSLDLRAVRLEGWLEVAADAAAVVVLEVAAADAEAVVVAEGSVATAWTATGPVDPRVLARALVGARGSVVVHGPLAPSPTRCVPAAAAAPPGASAGPGDASPPHDGSPSVSLGERTAARLERELGPFAADAGALVRAAGDDRRAVAVAVGALPDLAPHPLIALRVDRLRRQLEAELSDPVGADG